MPQYQQDLERIKQIAGKNPFAWVDVKGPYDRRPLPHYENLHPEAVMTLREALLQHHMDPFSPPIITIVGDTGAGKTHFLNQIIRNNLNGPDPRPPNLPYLFISVEPEDILRQADNVFGIEQVFCFAIQHALFRKNYPGLPSIRPIDVYAHQIIRVMLKDFYKNNPEGLFTRGISGFLRNKLWEESFIQSLVQDHSKYIPTKIMFELSHPRSQQVFDIILKTFREKYKNRDRKKEMLGLKELVLKTAFDISSQHHFFSEQRGSYTEQITEMLRLTKELKLPIAFVFDQFEDLQIPFSGSIRDLIERFLLQLLDWLRKIEEQAEHTDTPLCLLSITTDLEPQKYNRHIRTRLPTLPNGDLDIRLENDRLKELKFAEFMMRVYLNAFWDRNELRKYRPQDQNWPLTQREIKELHEKFMTQHAGEEFTPRNWLRLCRDAWNQKIQELETHKTTPDLPIEPKTHKTTPDLPIEPKTHTPTPDLPIEPKTHKTTPDLPIEPKTHKTTPDLPIEPKTHKTTPDLPIEPKTHKTTPDLPIEAPPIELYHQLIANLLFQAEINKIKNVNIPHSNEMTTFLGVFLEILQSIQVPYLQEKIQSFQTFTHRIPSNCVLFHFHHIPVLAVFSTKSNRGGGFHADWSDFQVNCRSMTEQQNISEDMYRLFLRLRKEEHTANALDDIIQNPKLTIEYLSDKDELSHFFALLLLAKRWHYVSAQIIPKGLTLEAIAPYLRDKIFTEDWQFFGKLKQQICYK
jgi:hypothetical protein